MHLRPAGEARLDKVAEVIEGNLLLVEIHADGPLRAGADEAHVTFQDVEELGDFINTGAAQEVTETGDPGIVWGGSGASIFRVQLHAAELVNRERLSTPTDPGLAEKNIPG